VLLLPGPVCPQPAPLSKRRHRPAGAAALAHALGGEYQFLHDAQASQCAVRVGKGDAAAQAQLRFGPGVAVGGRASADAVQGVDEAGDAGFVGILGVGRGGAIKRSGELGCGHVGDAMQDRRKPPRREVTGGTWF